MKNVWWLVAGAAAFIGYKMMSAADDLTYYFTKVSIDKSNTGLLRTTLEVTMRVKNPNSQGLTFDRFVGSLSNNGSQIALIDVNGYGKGITVAKNAETDITFPVEVSNLGLLAQILDLVINKTNPKVTINGTLSIGAFNIPINQTLPVSEGSGLGSVPEESTRSYDGLFTLAY